MFIKKNKSPPKGIVMIYTCYNRLDKNDEITFDKKCYAFLAENFHQIVELCSYFCGY